MNDLIRFEMSAPAIAKAIERKLAATTDPDELVKLSAYLKAAKSLPEIRENEERKHEIFWGELLAYWKVADAVDGKTAGKGRPTINGTDDTIYWSDIGVERHLGEKWLRLRHGFEWDSLLALKEAIRLPTLSAILNRIPAETILVTPTPGKYPIIYADPPWEYNFAQFADVAVSQYESLSVEKIVGYEIKDEPLTDYFDKDAVLFLWATNPKLVESLEVMTGWGFEYKTNICWDKVTATSSTMGKWLKGRHEFLLIGTKGNLPPPNPDRKIESVYQEKKTKHSKKPEYFYELIEGWYQLPEEAKYLELFCRRKHSERWQVLGNQIAQSSEE
jgi:N6-adenosine-specific RNA methylase IME4